MNDVRIDGKETPTSVAHLIGFFALHTAVWTGLNLVVAGGDRVGFDQLGLGTTPWVRQFHVALLTVLAIQILYVSRKGWWREVMVDTEKTPRKWLVVFPVLVLLAGIGKFTNDGLTDAPTAYWVGMTATMILVGTTEELTFRGILLVGGRKAFGGEAKAFLLSSALFGLFHLPNALMGQDLAKVLSQVVVTAVIGSAFYALRRTGGSLVPCIVLHAAYDWMLIQGAFS